MRARIVPRGLRTDGRDFGTDRTRIGGENLAQAPRVPKDRARQRVGDALAHDLAPPAFGRQAFQRRAPRRRLKRRLRKVVIGRRKRAGARGDRAKRREVRRVRRRVVVRGRHRRRRRRRRRRRGRRDCGTCETRGTCETGGTCETRVTLRTSRVTPETSETRRRAAARRRGDVAERIAERIVRIVVGESTIRR